MLYRNPETPRPAPALARVFQALNDWRLTHRRRRADLDLLSMNGHLRRDLGLDDLARYRR